MDVSIPIKSTQASVTSLDGEHIASLDGLLLQIRRTSTLDVVRTIDLPPYNSARFLSIRWSPISKGAGACNRVLLADEDAVRVWDLQDTQWSARIDNGTGGTGKIANVEFGSDDTEVLVFSSFGAKVTVWSLWTGYSVEIKDPKFDTKGYGRSRPGRSGIFAMLTRPGPVDVVTLHAPGSYAMLKSFTLPTTDARGLLWSPNGKWLALWDMPSTGYKVLIYTADGNLYRTYSGDYYDEALAELGVKSIKWSPNGDFLAIGGYENTVTLLSTKTFSPAIHLAHPHKLQLSRGQVWQEQATSSGRSYAAVTRPLSPPGAPSEPNRTSAGHKSTVETASIVSGWCLGSWQSSHMDNSQIKIGVSIMSFSADGSYLAVREDSMPTTVWIWDLSHLQARAVIVQHSIVKQLAWHPTDPDLLLIQCSQTENILYLWNASQDRPCMFNMSAPQFSSKVDAQWIQTRPDRRPRLIFGDLHSFAVVHPYGKDDIPSPVIKAEITAERAHNTDDDDSLFEILSGRKPALGDDTTQYHMDSDIDTPNSPLQDTFRFRKGIGAY